MLRMSLLAILLIPLSGLAHRDHGMDHAETGYSMDQWQESLARFTATGHPADLAIARTAMRQHQRAGDASAQNLYLKAWTNQADHRFDQAWEDAEQLRGARPGWNSVHLLQSGLALVRGDVAAASAACKRLRGASAAIHLTCQAQTLARPTAEQYGALAATLSAATANSALETTMRNWIELSLGDVAVRAGLAPAAVHHYQWALERSPSVRAQVALAQALLDSDRPDAALLQLPEQSPALPVRVKRLVVVKQALGDHALDRSELARLDRQFEHWLAHDDLTHGREMAEYYLKVKDDAPRARAIIEQSMTHQREFEDARLLREATLAERVQWHRQSAEQGRHLVSLLSYTRG